MGIRNKILVYSLISIVIISGIGLGIFFGVFYNKNNVNDDQIVFTLEGSASTKNYTMTELMSFPSITDSAGYRKSTGTLVGPNIYKGVELSVLLEDVGGIVPGEEIEVIADDGYKVSFTSEMLKGKLPSYDSETGDYIGIADFRIILAYEVDGVAISDGTSVLRIAALPIEGEDYFTDGSPWVKEVVKIKLISEVSWIVYLYGITNDSINKPTFEAYMHINDSELRVVYQLQEGDRTNTYEGLALWRIISFIDGEVVGGLTTFNDSLALSGYDVVLKNPSSESLTLRSEDIARNDSYVLAARKNSVYLIGNEAPLIIVGPNVSISQTIMGINEIHIILD